MTHKPFFKCCFLLFFLLPLTSLFAQVQKAPSRHEGEGPWSQLIIRGVTLINGTLSPPVGPVDIVVEGNRIVQIANVGAPGAPVNPA
ncbi:MAG: hypothetical protein ABIW47_08450, partial [Ginsengibacter sp.]